MFVFTKVDNENEKFVLVPNKPLYTIGRLSTDLILSEDLSISRTHVRLSLPTAGSNESLTMTDLGSKYGTFINNDIQSNKKMQAKTPIPLKIGDKIRLGALKNVWQVSQLSLVTTPSALGRAELAELQQLLKPLGGELLPNWTKECSHLTMDNVTVTVKLLHALLDNKPIVNIAFWRELSKAAHRIHLTDDWPKPADFAPAQTLDMPSIKWNPKRTKLFASKTFVFCNRKHFEMYAPVVQKAGGACKDLNTGVRRQFLTKPDVVVIQYVPSTQSQATETIHSVQEILEQAERRLVPDYEIGLAVLHCSTDKFCNPSYKMVENSLPTTESMDSSVLVLNTVSIETDSNTNKGSELTVAESEAYPINVPSEIPETLSQASPVAKSKSMHAMRQRNNVMFMDSSDEDIETEQPSVSKKPVASAASKAKPKRKLAIIVDSSDEDKEALLQQRKITKTLPGDKSKQTTSRSCLGKAAEQEEANKSISPRRSTRSNPVQQQEVQKPATTTPRRSLRGKQVPEKEISEPQIDEASEEEQEILQLKAKPPAAKEQNEPKKTKLTVPLIDEDSEEEEAPFQFNKKSPATKEPAPSKSPAAFFQSNKKTAETEQSALSKSIKQTLGGSKSNPTAKISVRNFLGKSQQQSQAEANESVATAAASQPRKRLRLEQLNESDSDDNDNLFQFAGSKKPRSSFALEKNGSFIIESGIRKERNNDRDDDSVSTEPFIPDNRTNSRYVVPEPRMQPIKVDISGWLSISRVKEEIQPKAEADAIKMDAEETEPSIKKELGNEQVERSKYIESMRECIQVRMCNLDITVRAHDEANEVEPVEQNQYYGRKNFKKFVKNQILHPHQRVLPMKRMQIAEGRVKVL